LLKIFMVQTYPQVRRVETAAILEFPESFDGSLATGLPNA